MLYGYIENNVRLKDSPVFNDKTGLFDNIEKYIFNTISKTYN